MLLISGSVLFSVCRNLLLQLMHALFPYLIQMKDAVSEHSKVVSRSFFKELASLVDDLHSSDDPDEAFMVRVARQVIIDGQSCLFIVPLSDLLTY